MPQTIATTAVLLSRVTLCACSAFSLGACQAEGLQVSRSGWPEASADGGAAATITAGSAAHPAVNPGPLAPDAGLAADGSAPPDATLATEDAAFADVAPAPLPPPLERVHLGQDRTGAHVDQDSGSTVRFIAVGDTGTGDANQAEVAAAMAHKCKRDGCDFVMLLGDNVYENGPTGVDDVQWQMKFEQPYAALDLPFYAVLGNHDVGVLIGSGYNANAAPIEVGYTVHSEKWKMPAAHYTVSVGDVGLLMFDTTALYNHVIEQGDQKVWVGPARDALLAKHSWVLAAAHHTYISNGEHGNAGSYGYLETDLGADVKDFVEGSLCGKVDVLFTGHDHNRQWLDTSACADTEIVVSGAGAKVRPLVGKNPAYFSSDELGFFYVVVDGDTLTGQFIDATGHLDFERTLTK